ncbi:MAG: hypothetical protein KKB82_01405 [Candidatus Omnitrophica bacterium]|nr:hypothetical protein [Candidatus Omnitrophota bacterium]
MDNCRKQTNLFTAVINSQEDLFIPVVFLFAFFVRLFFLAFSDNFLSAEPMLNISASLHIFSEPALFNNIHYLQPPLLLYSLAIAIWLGAEQIIAPRFLMLFFGCLTIWPFFKLVQYVWDRKTAIYAAVLLCCLPGHILYSSLTTSDVICAFFIITGLNFLFREKIAAAAAFFVLACGYSYFGWVVLLIAILQLAITEGKSLETKTKTLMIFGAIVSPFILLWLVLLKYKYGTYCLFTHNFLSYDYLIKTIYRTMLGVQTQIKQLIKDLSLAPAIVGILGMLANIIKRKQYNLMLWIGMIILFSCVQWFREEIAIQRAAILLLSILFLPFIAEGVFLVSKSAKAVFGAFSVVIITLICICFIFNAAGDAYRVPGYIKEISGWLSANVKTNDLIFMQRDERGYYSTIMMGSGLPQGNFYFLNEMMETLPVALIKKSYLIREGVKLSKEVMGLKDIAKFGDFYVYQSIRRAQ